MEPAIGGTGFLTVLIKYEKIAPVCGGSENARPPRISTDKLTTEGSPSS
ncbi:hypothetical protein MUG84_08760 [Paenibacillus sp. KQZ6P-2]|uniref:Uncharacterized protein n=1 Tax=Paenibacillus mangrovi TaxID=2931978 RepID=A0A9X1WM66_9BACL|nr:hypothetical protein [Paenibacillus mangrovi]MCJ8011832.1 hypothetical protein [Paenibacillus mangrovi]